jgi:predicted ATPase
LANVELNLSPITVLVGQNGTGKSNLVDTFRFLRDAVTFGLDHAVDQRGGVSIVRQYSPSRPYIVSMRLNLEYDLADTIRNDDYSFRFSSTKEAVNIEEEQFSWTEEFEFWEEDRQGTVVETKRFEVIRNQDGEVTVNGESEKRPIRPRYQLALNDITPATWVYRLGRPFATFLRNMRFAAVYPNIMRQPARLETERTLREDCSNWGSIIRQMRQRRTGEQSLQRVIELMSLVLPELEQITVRNIGGYVIPQFLVKDTRAGRSHYLDPIQLSDGTLRLFGLLLHLYQQPAPSLLAIEEPEQTIHPGLIGVLMEAFQEAAEKMQLLITTHSPYVLDYFNPSLIRVVTLSTGETQVSPIKKSQVKTVKEGLMTMSEIMALDGLRPEL